jgi:hypothetical protein
MKSTYEQIKDFEKWYRKQYLKCFPIYYYIKVQDFLIEKLSARTR